MMHWFLPWKHILCQQDSPSLTRHAFCPSSHPTLLLSEKMSEMRKNMISVGLNSFIPLQSSFLCTKTYLVLTNTEKPRAVRTEVNVIDLLLVRCKVVHLTNQILYDNRLWRISGWQYRLWLWGWPGWQVLNQDSWWFSSHAMCFSRGWHEPNQQFMGVFFLHLGKIRKTPDPEMAIIPSCC